MAGLRNYTPFEQEGICELGPVRLSQQGYQDLLEVAIYLKNRKLVFYNAPFRKLAPKTQEWIIKVAQALNCPIRYNFLKIFTVPRVRCFFEDKRRGFGIFITSIDDMRKLLEIGLLDCAAG